jgi:hypothetical protein
MARLYPTTYRLQIHNEIILKVSQHYLIIIILFRDFYAKLYFFIKQKKLIVKYEKVININKYND